jgi:hypothetical protein
MISITPEDVVGDFGQFDRSFISPGVSWRIGERSTRVSNYVNFSWRTLVYLHMHWESQGDFVKSPEGFETIPMSS